jgi:cis-3-alkyl-4-acyloxetan-2-one decarboxylase
MDGKMASLAWKNSWSQKRSNIEVIMIDAHDTFDGTWPFAPHFCTKAGFRQHYVDEGKGDPVLLLHGQPTWGYIYRDFIGPLAKTNRVIVPDHMGFGKSETPQDRIYTLKTHVENLTALVEDLDLQNITLVMQDWGGPIGYGFAVRNPGRIKQMVPMNTYAGYGTVGQEGLPDPHKSPWFMWINKAMSTGQYEQVLRNLDVTILSVLNLIGFDNSAKVDQTFIRAYAAPFATPSECKGAIEFPLDVHLNRIRDFVKAGFAGVPAIQKKRAMMIEGMQDRAIPPALAIADFKGLWPDAPVHKIERAGHYCQEDAAQEIVALLQEFLRAAS